MKIFQLSTLGTWIDGAIAMPYQVSEFSGIYENTLVCTLNSGGVLLLDIEMEKLNHFLRRQNTWWSFSKKPDSPIFIGLKHITFIEINAGTGELLRQVDIEEELKE